MGFNIRVTIENEYEYMGNDGVFVMITLPVVPRSNEFFYLTRESLDKLGEKAKALNDDEIYPGYINSIGEYDFSDAILVKSVAYWENGDIAIELSSIAF